MQRLLLAVLFLAGLVACSRPPAVRTVAVVTLNSTEQMLLGEIVELHLASRLKIPMDRLPEVADTRMGHETMVSGQADLMPMYLTDALTSVLRLPSSTNHEEIRERLRLEFDRRFQAEWLPPLGLHRQVALAVSAERSEYARVRTLAQMGPMRPGWAVGTSSEFLTRKDGLGALLKAYDARLKGPPRVMEARQRYEALKSGAVDVAVGYRTDSQLLDPAIRRLVDEQQLFFPGETAIVVRKETLAAVPGLREALAELSGKFTDERMQALSAEVDAQRRPPREVAAGFLRSVGLRQ